MSLKDFCGACARSPWSKEFCPTCKSIGGAPPNNFQKVEVETRRNIFPLDGEKLELIKENENLKLRIVELNHELNKLRTEN